jgi:hypothetical protein
MLFYHPAAAYQRMCGYDLALSATEGYGTLKEEQNIGIVSAYFIFKCIYIVEAGSPSDDSP